MSHFEPRRLTHANLFVSDYEASMRFYHAVAGLDEAYRQPENKAGFLTNGNTHHDLAVTDIRGPYGKDRKPGLFHIAFELETEVDLVQGYRKATDAGVKFEFTADHDITHSVYLLDPDGNMCEVYADVIKDWWNHRRGVVTKPKPKWEPGDTKPIQEQNYEPRPDIGRVESAIFHPVKTTHAAFVCADFQAMCEWYRDVIGLTVLTGGANDDLAVLGGTCGEPSVSLFRAGNNRPPGLHHVGLEARDYGDLETSVRRLVDEGYEPGLFVRHSLGAAAILEDPDGIRMQFHKRFSDRYERFLGIEDALALYLL